MKISIIGAGNVGSTAGMIIAQKGLGDVTLIDIAEGVAKGKALDIQHAVPLFGSHSKLNGSSSFSDIKNSDVVVVAAGMARKPGMSRDDLLKVNEAIVRAVAREIKMFAPESIVIVVTNPLDVMAYAVMKETEFPSKRVMGMAGVLDSARMRAFIAEAANAHPSEVEAMVLGGHGDSMVPLVKHTKIRGRPVTDYVPAAKLGEIVHRTRNAGAEIVEHLKTGSAYYAPGASVAEMVEAIATDSGKVLPVSAYLQGEYGYSDIYLGVPAMLGGEGIVKIMNLELTPEEKVLLDKSAEDVRENIKKLGN